MCPFILSPHISVNARVASVSTCGTNVPSAYTPRNVTAVWQQAPTNRPQGPLKHFSPLPWSLEPMYPHSAPSDGTHRRSHPTIARNHINSSAGIHWKRRKRKPDRTSPGPTANFARAPTPQRNRISQHQGQAELARKGFQPQRKAPPASQWSSAAQQRLSLLLRWAFAFFSGPSTYSLPAGSKVQQDKPTEFLPLCFTVVEGTDKPEGFVTR